MSDVSSSVHQVDLESQHTVLLITSTSTKPSRDHWRWIYVILQVRKLLISSRANRYAIISSGTNTKNTGHADFEVKACLPDSPQVSGDVHLPVEDDSSNAVTAAKLQKANISKIVKEKDFESLQKFGVQGIAEALNTDLQDGIPGHDVLSHRTASALSRIVSPIQRFFKLLLQSCNNYIIFLLLVSAVLSIGFGIKQEGLSTGWYEGAIILSVIIIHVFAPPILDSWIQTPQNHAVASGETKMVVEVFRGGSRCEIEISDVVSGDIVCLRRGSVVPGDGLFVSGEFLVLDDDGTATTIDNKKPFMFCGAKVMGGNGRMLVTSVGMDTAWGELMNKVANTPSQHHLPAQLDKVSQGTLIIGLILSILILVVLFSRFMIERKDEHSGLPDLKGKPTASEHIMDVIEKAVMKPSGRISTIMTSLAILLVGVVEGIPIFVTLAICHWNKTTLSGKATSQGILACVTIGSATAICTDKTGVLTLKPLEVESFYIGSEVIENDYVTRVDTGVRNALCDGISAPLLMPSSSHCSSTDPLVSWAVMNLRMESEVLRQNSNILHTKELSTNEAGHGVLMRKPNTGEDGDMSIHWKGPATTILAMCSHYNDKQGATKVMDEQSILSFIQIIEDMQSKHLKTIAFAYKHTNDQMLEENGLILIALLGLRYSFCTDVVEACEEAGVNIILISEDNVSKLRDIVPECGIHLNSDKVVDGKSFRNCTQENRIDMVDNICVMENSIPSDRLLLVQCLKEKGHVVAMVGVGANDSPTLKEADVGIAMGIWSNKSARESSEIIIWDGDLSFLVTIIRCGRCIYYNIQKYIQLELTMNIAWLLITSITTTCSGDSAIPPVQLFWAIMVVTLLGGLALLMEPPTEELMKKPPVRRTERLISKAMWRNIVTQALYQTTILVVFQYKGPDLPGISKKVTESIVFNSFVLCQVFNQVNSRELEKKNVLKGILHNLWFWVAVVVIVILQVGFIETAHIIVGNARLNWAQWGVCLLIGMVSLAIDLGVKSATSVVRKREFNSHIGSISPSHNVSESANLELPLINGTST